MSATCHFDTLRQQGRVPALEMRSGWAHQSPSAAIYASWRRRICANDLWRRAAPTPAEAVAARMALSGDEKLALAQTALGLIGEEQLIFLDAGSTHLYLADLLPHDRRLTVVTNALATRRQNNERRGSAPFPAASWMRRLAAVDASRGRDRRFPLIRCSPYLRLRPGLAAFRGWSVRRQCSKSGCGPVPAA
ncbi:hypothetical protein M8494_21605 [Serratia ureilytica]